jgi:thiol-disulfide isomerase/thioredoxin
MKLLHILHVSLAMLMVLPEDVARFSGMMAIAATEAGRAEPVVRQVSATAPLPKKLRSCMVFTASWCPNCPAQKAQLDKLEKVGWVRQTWGNAPLAHIWIVDADWYPRIVEKYGVTGLPTTLLFEDGRLIGRLERQVSAKELAVLLRGR